MMKKMFTSMPAMFLAATVFCGTLAPGCGQAFADGVTDGIAELQHGWARAYYQVPDRQKPAVFKDLAARAHQFTIANPGRPEPMVWESIILSSYAKFEGGLGALSKVKAARDLLEQAEKIQPDVLNGSIYTSLGSLYDKVPRWPIGFGDKQKARAYLEKAVQVNPDGIDPNYFYGDFLLEQGEYGKAREYLEKALSAPARPGREDADQGRRAEVQQLLEKARQHG
jgi:tetratricopeptide (TPR) repeat protein